MGLSNIKDHGQLSLQGPILTPGGGGGGGGGGGNVGVRRSVIAMS